MGVKNKNMKRPGLLFVINDIRPGGAEMFMFRLAAYLQDSFSIFILSLSPDQDDEHFVGQFTANQKFERLRLPRLKEDSLKNRLFWKLNAIAFRFGYAGLYRKLRTWEEQRLFGQCLKNRNIRAVNSSSSRSDAFSARVLKNKFGVPLIITMHSSYNPDCWNDFGSSKQLKETCNEIFTAADHVFYTADENILIFKELNLNLSIQPEKCYLGYHPPETNGLTFPQDLGIPSSAPLFCMMARGIPEKGWDCAISAFLMLMQEVPDAHLILISTETEHIAELRGNSLPHPNIHFLGFQPFPAPLLARATATLLPSHFAESLPYAIIESLAVGTPVFATPIAEIPQMLESHLGSAGATIPLDGRGRAIEQELFRLLKVACTQPDQLALWKQAAKSAFEEKFSMQVCGDRYKTRITTVIDGK